MAKFYITTTLPYVNAEPHIGTALEFVQADAMARYHRLRGDEVIFNTGTDEHGLKIYRKAEELGVTPQAYCDEQVRAFSALKDQLGIQWDRFIRTTDPAHIKAAQEFWKLCDSRGFIYKKNYSVKYCVGCELEKTDSELDHGTCVLHPNLEIEMIQEENYFFKFSEFQNDLLALYTTNPQFVVPPTRLHEIKTFVEQGLQDFSISRLKEKMPWGVSVPNDESQVMYVWFDALVNYISTLGWPGDINTFGGFWPGVQVAGKDNLRQQSAMWQAMLLAAGLPTSKQIFIHGFITAGGQKMSKSLGNVVSPAELVTKYGTEAVRYYLLGGLPAYEDGDFTVERFEEFYTARLANGIGNLVARTIAMVEKYCEGKTPAPREAHFFKPDEFWQTYDAAFHAYDFAAVIESIRAQLIDVCDKAISETEPWNMVKRGEDVAPLMYELSECLRHLMIALLPIIPSTATAIGEKLGIMNETAMNRNWGGLISGAPLHKGESLFPRLPKE